MFIILIAVKEKFIKESSFKLNQVKKIWGKKVLRRIFVPKRDVVAGGWRRLHDVQPYKRRIK
jgi:hypothetical protein